MRIAGRRPCRAAPGHDRDVTRVSPSDVAALNKAMDEMGASTIENFVGPKAAPKGVPEKKSHVIVPKEII
jgi:hypothetical protein